MKCPAENICTPENAGSGEPAAIPAKIFSAVSATSAVNFHRLSSIKDQWI